MQEPARVLPSPFFAIPRRRGASRPATRRLAAWPMKACSEVAGPRRSGWRPNTGSVTSGTLSAQLVCTGGSTPISVRNQQMQCEQKPAAYEAGFAIGHWPVKTHAFAHSFSKNSCGNAFIFR